MIRRAMHVFTPSGAFRPWATVLIAVLGFGLALGLTIGYVRKVDRDAERRNVQRSRDICGIIVLIDDRNRGLPPVADSATMQFRDELHRYRVRLGC